MLLFVSVLRGEVEDYPCIFNTPIPFHGKHIWSAACSGRKRHRDKLCHEIHHPTS